MAEPTFLLAMSGLLQTIGRVHVATVHFPIALLGDGRAHRELALAAAGESTFSIWPILPS
jgi:hypothetical protein